MILIKIIEFRFFNSEISKLMALSEKYIQFYIQHNTENINGPVWFKLCLVLD